MIGGVIDRAFERVLFDGDNLSSREIDAIFLQGCYPLKNRTFRDRRNVPVVSQLLKIKGSSSGAEDAVSSC
jgi:hypothetical protein